MIALLFLIPSIAFSQGTGKIIDEMHKKHPTYGITLLYPINVASAKINLSIEIPKNYKKLDNRIDPNIVGYMLTKGNDINAWTEYFTVTPFISQKMDAHDLIKTFSENYKVESKNVKIIDKKYISKGTHKIAYTDILHFNQSESRLELLRVFGASGPFDCMIIQYSIHVKSEIDLNKYIKKLNNFFEKNVRILEK